MKELLKLRVVVGILFFRGVKIIQNFQKYFYKKAYVKNVLCQHLAETHMLKRRCQLSICSMKRSLQLRQKSICPAIMRRMLFCHEAEIISPKHML